MNSIKIFFVIAIFSLMTASCKKSSPSGTSSFAVRMTDAPGNFSAVYIDLQSVIVTGGSGGDVTLNVHPGIYNLLDFSNGIDTLIASGNLQVGSVEQVRLVLGSNNSVVVNGQSYPLSTPSAQQSGLKLQVHQTLEAGVSYSLLLDFDANQSVVLQGNGSYLLKPVIRTVEAAVSGSISGLINPISAMVVVTATDNASGISYSSVTQVNGQFLLSGLPAGIYSVTITPPSPLLPVTMTNVMVTTGVKTNVGTINL
jgi:hypothetical protein